MFDDADELLAGEDITARYAAEMSALFGDEWADVIGSDGSTLSDIFNVVHPIGEGVLKAFGAGALAEPLRQIENEGIRSTMSPQERAAFDVKQKQAAVAKEQAKEQAKAQAAQQAAQEQQAAQQKAAARSPWKIALYVAGGVVALFVGVKLLRGRRARTANGK
jgi:hypothetical protein